MANPQQAAALAWLAEGPAGARRRRVANQPPRVRYGLCPPNCDQGRGCRGRERSRSERPSRVAGGASCVRTRRSAQSRKCCRPRGTPVPLDRALPWQVGLSLTSHGSGPEPGVCFFA
jgi:hypothetical protein